MDKKKISQELKDKYTLENESFKRVVKSDVERKIEVEIGDSKTPDKFLPQVKTAWFDNEYNVSIRAEEHPEAVFKSDKEKLIYSTPDYDVVQYDKPDAGDEGGHELEWILPKKPSSNKLIFTLRFKGNVKFYYQPALTDEEILEGAVRPDNVVGSYAVYIDKSNHRWGDNNYATGKIQHIYRPKAIDANGTETWCDLYLPQSGEQETNIQGFVTVPQEFLDSAVYPVTIDPTFGQTSVGASSTSGSLDMMYCNSETASEAGTMTSISLYVASGAYDNNERQVALFSKTSVNAGTFLVSQSSAVFNPPTPDAWNVGTINNYSFSAGDYWLVMWGVEYSYAYDNVTNYVGAFNGRSYSGTWANFSGMTNHNARKSIYATYTAGGSSSNSPSNSPSLSPSSSISPSNSPSLSPSASLSPSSSVSPSNSPSQSPSNSPSLSPSSSISPSRSPSNSPSLSPSSSISPSNSPSNSPSLSPSSSQSPSNSPSNSPSLSPSSSRSPSNSPSNSPSLSPSSSQSPSNSPSNSPSLSPSSSQSPSLSPSSSVSPSAQPVQYVEDVELRIGNSPSPSESPSISPSTSISPSYSPSRSISPSISPSYSPSSSQSPSVSPSSSTSPSNSPSYSPSSSVSPSTAPIQYVEDVELRLGSSPSPSVSPSISPSISPSSSQSPSLSPSSSQSPSLSPSSSQSPSISPSSSISPSQSPSYSPSGSQSPSVSPSSSISPSQSPSISPSYSPSSSLSPSQSPSVSPSVSPSSSQSPSVSPSGSYSPSSSISPSYSPSSSQSPSLSPSSSLSPSISPSSSLSPSASVSPSVSPSTEPCVWYEKRTTLWQNRNTGVWHTRSRTTWYRRVICGYNS